MKKPWLEGPRSILDVFKRRQQYYAEPTWLVRFDDAPPSRNLGINSPIRSLGDSAPCIHTPFWYMCPEGSTTANWLYWRCRACNSRWLGPWKDGTVRYEEAVRRMQTERVLDYEDGSRLLSPRERIDPVTGEHLPARPGVEGFEYPDW